MKRKFRIANILALAMFFLLVDPGWTEEKKLYNFVNIPEVIPSLVLVRIDKEAT